MTGPTLTNREITLVLRTAVERLERLGIPRELALRAVARDNRVPIHRVQALVDATTFAETAPEQVV